MRHRIRAAAVAGVVAVLVAGCDSGGGVRVVPPDPAGGTDISADCGDVVLDLTNSDTPGAICLRVGSTLRLRVGERTAEADESGAALTEVSAGVYRGAQAGEATLGGTRRACPDEPGKVSCLAVVPWRITVDVR
ncbi:hypothetical protein [Actinacidiphila bryophytorum]|uniref:Lipoprotein n=1 Tax=Actinacidiphila bryophytorum TaxID=1436133 RepID=A0A9W4MEB8_9ACTN|nr:hypothetical protein [Actinacidiphila bryophytorum]MBM9439661.1 hypothetical protein [Actinacidiphila bryophytorum]MBN6544244.1 hypothetical protein [Actinacidiphila bryophytorum]CAG7653104.1 conserved hypothetical protein [Actinacidiphila bryophytorum]